MKHPNRQPAIRHLRRLLAQVRGDMLRSEKSHRSLIARLPDAHRAGARRLLDDAVIRRAGRERIEGLLRACGFPFAFSEQGDARRDLETISFLLLLQSGEVDPARWDGPRPRSVVPVQDETQRASEKIFGRRRGLRTTRIMVTMPLDAANSSDSVRACFAAGMDAVRINCARDNADTWKQVISRIRREAAGIRRRCTVFMDLGGPKLRTGPVPAEPAVVKIRPVRDSLGAVTHPALVTFVPSCSRRVPTRDGEAILPVSQEVLEVLPAGSRLWMRDARGLRRTLRVVESLPVRLVCECSRTAYIVPGTRISSREKGKKRKKGRALNAEFQVDCFAGTEGGIDLAKGMRLRLVPRPMKAAPAQNARASIGLTTTIDVSRIPVGTRVLFDDGKLEGRVAGVGESALDIEITFAAGGSKTLRADRGVNFPGVDLGLSPMTRKDRVDLRFAARHADMVALSFIRGGMDIRVLRKALAGQKAGRLPIVVKIENALAVECLDEIILEALRHPSAAILVARGDLAVECGFPSLPALQQEILRRSHLAGLPVIWATEVLENLSQRGIPTRSDLTDAHVAGETECVLLNKGDYVAESVALLNRMYAARGGSRKLKSASRTSRKEVRHASQ